MSPVELLKEARNLIANPEQHTTGYYARTSTGLLTDPSSPDATCWCALGSVYRVAQKSGVTNVGKLAHQATELLYEVLPPGYTGIAALNDLGGHSLVMDLFARGIEHGEKME